MKKMIAALAFAATGFASTASAGAYEDAIARDVCLGNSVISAEYLTTGELKVICPAGTLTGTAANGLGGTGLSAGAAAGGAAALVVLLVVIGDDDTTTTTTTTTTGS